MRRTRGQKRFTTSEVANDTAAHHAAIHCLRRRTTDPAVCSKQTYHRPNQPYYSLYPVAR